MFASLRHRCSDKMYKMYKMSKLYRMHKMYSNNKKKEKELCQVGDTPLVKITRLCFLYFVGLTNDKHELNYLMGVSK